MSLTFASYLHLQLSDSSLESQKLLLKSCFFPFQSGDLLLNSAVLSLLEIEVSLHLFLDTHQLIGKTLFDICSFHCEDRFECVLLRPEDLHFFLMIVEFCGDVFDLLLKIGHKLLPGFEVYP
jgi:hypothetical protein